MNLDEALDTFIIEARELLQAMEDALLGAGREGPDNDAVNAIFRAAHTIKGSAGLFGLDGIVAFTHVLESVLDRARGGDLAFDSDLISLLLACGDHLRILVDRVSSGDAGTDEAERQLGAELVAKLGRYMGATAVTHPAVRPEAASAPKEAAERPWHISVRFGPNVLRNGMDPLSFLNYLQTIGRIMRVEILTDGMPDVATMDPESCYLGFELALVTKAERAQIESVFEFVRDDCELRVLSPESTPADYADLIRALPEDDLRLGEILVRCGTLTQDVLAHALGTQAMEPIGHARTIGEILVQEGAVDQGAVDAGLERQRQTRDRKGQESQTVRVDAQKLDLLIDLVGELVIAGSAVGVIGQKHKMAALTEAVSTLSRLVEGVRDRALQLRMVQIGATFNRFKRVVHDVSQELGKDIELVISGEETELDKTVVEQIADPLTHLVRNAIDHGIESADARQAAGKPVRGTLRLNAFHDSGSIVIEVSDDGGGLRRDRILAKAVERGLVNPGATLSDSEVYGLIFEPGFSTAAAVTNLSGRGVGMDVVKRNVTALRGTIEIDSKEGQGSRFSVRLPLTLAIIDGFLVRLGNATFVVPLDIVDECVELPPENAVGGAGRDYVNLRGQVLPFVRLREVFSADGEPAKRQNIVVVKHANRRLGLVVDELLGEAQTVIKPLGRLFQGLSGISGSTILGDGRVALIVDVPALAQGVEVRESGALSTGRRADMATAA
ncbi:MAG: chemotaxis protein CheA [Burkholderiales bacterium]|nr:chemotaxis protein CheA [Burkholderiales bacterium]